MPHTLSLPILFQDADVIAIDKPAGVTAIPGRDESQSVLEILRNQLDHRVLVVHRLDKETSGVMLFAMHAQSQRHLSHQFQNNTIEKEYLALVAGKPPQDEGEIVAAIGPHPTSPKRMSVLKHGGRPARTLWKIEQRFRNFTLLRVFPKTGKTHQIRVHLAHIGLPLAIDPIYHPHSGTIFLSDFKRDYRPNRNQQERPLIARLTLHAHCLQFEHPDGRRIILESPLPKDLRATLNQMSRHG
jgi:23S rRNA pseudouridine1911/1915/1917 synthase